MTRATATHALRRRLARIDRRWLHTLAFTLAMVALVTLAIGADRAFAVTALASCGVGFGFFYLMFATGAHFGLVMANGLAVYVCLFAFFRDTNFQGAPERAVLVAFVLPVLSFLLSCTASRIEIDKALGKRHQDLPHRLPPLVRWVPGAMAVGATSFFLPEIGMTPAEQGYALIAAMAVIALFVAVAARDLVLLLIDVTTVFENVAERVHQLVMPMVAFLTYYALVILVFTCLYRITEMAFGPGEFRVNGELRSLTFAEALYFSVVTMATVGYGDIVPQAAPVRALAAMEVILGVLLLLFGFREIVRAREAPARRDEARRGGDGQEGPAE